MKTRTLFVILGIAAVATACTEATGGKHPTEYPVTHEQCAATDPVQTLTDQECVPPT